MPAQQLAQIRPLPKFDIPTKYKEDIWPIMEWDIYIKAETKRKSDWTLRSNTTENKFNFLLCKNKFIVEELKYFMYYIIEVKKIKITTFAEYYDRYKILAQYINQNMLECHSILDLTNLSSFERFLVKERNNKKTIKNGTTIINNEIQRASRKSRFTTFITYTQSVVRDFYEKDMKETDKLIWQFKNLPFSKGGKPGKKLDFRFIKDPITLKCVQDFCLFQLQAITFSAVYSYLHSIRIFIEWLDRNYPKKKISTIDRKIIEEYFTWLRTQSSYSSHLLNTSILNLKVFFDWGQLNCSKYMPTVQLILASDYTFKTKKESKYLTDDEVRAFINVLPQMPKTYAKMCFCLLFMGMRYSELAALDVNCIKQNEDGTYYLDLWQYKTNASCEKPIFKNCIDIINSEIVRNRKRFGEENVKYVFVNKNNKPILVGTINDNINKVIIKNNIRGKDGNLLHITTHRFRATVATNLISEGTPADVAAQLLGQTTLSSLSHYATVTNDVVKEQLKPRIEKDQILISNIGKIKKIDSSSSENAIPLCNGFCNKNPLTTPCAKANQCFSCSMFVPSSQFLNNYYMQLIEIEATIKIAEQNDYVLMLNKAKKDKEALEKIIQKLEARKNE